MSDHRDRRPQLGGYDAPLETGVVLQELVEVRHELIDRLAHVHVPELRPDSVSVRQSRRLVLHPSLRLELVPERSNKKISATLLSLPRASMDRLHVCRPILDGEQVVSHRLVRKLV